MPSISRRKALQAGAAVLATGIAGCSSVVGQSGATLEVIRVVNEREESHTVHLIVEHNGEIAYWSSLDLAPATTREDGVSESTGVAIENEWPATPEQLTVYARLDNQSGWNTLALHEQGNRCHMVRAHVELSDQPPTAVSLLTSNDCRN
ncbi:hypothetical protein [Haladaptatus sp. ZSTT2]|uniref:hypothetical protein n=1 Tax=Haladaptatus sp. ZSTT2 TaxID=3120515 RepID=UPI00300F5769